MHIECKSIGIFVYLKKFETANCFDIRYASNMILIIVETRDGYQNWNWNSVFELIGIQSGIGIWIRKTLHSVLDLELELEVMAGIGNWNCYSNTFAWIPIPCSFVLKQTDMSISSMLYYRSKSIKDFKFTLFGISRQYFLRFWIQKFKGHRSRSLGMGK